LRVGAAASAAALSALSLAVVVPAPVAIGAFFVVLGGVSMVFTLVDSFAALRSGRRPLTRPRLQQVSLVWAAAVVVATVSVAGGGGIPDVQAEMRHGERVATQFGGVVRRLSAEEYETIQMQSLRVELLVATLFFAAGVVVSGGRLEFEREELASAASAEPTLPAS
jgi:hypothetical protein